MKKEFILLVTLFVFIYSNAQIVDIPDPVFKNVLVNNQVVDTTGDGNGNIDADINNDGEIQVSEAEAVIGLIIRDFNITSLEGIQSFTNLEVLNCRNNNLTSLNLNQNNALRELTCHENLLSSLDVTQNPNLEMLNCSTNQLINIDVTQNINLKLLLCSDNQITNLDVLQNLNLEDLWFGHNQLTTIDITENINLKTLLCEYNNITILDVSQNEYLEYLWCYENQITNLDLTQNINLKNIWCEANQLSSLDVSQNLNLEYLWCTTNQLVNLNIKNGNNTILNDFGATDNPNLMCIQVDDVVYANNNSSWFKDPVASYSEECLLGSEDLMTLNILFFPNPVQEILHVKTNERIEDVKLYSSLGNLILEINDSNIDVSKLPTGLYFVQFSFEGKTMTKRIVKE